MSKNASFAISLAMAALLIFSLLSVPVYAAKQMPPFTLENPVNNGEISSDSFSGKSLLVVFFATWCVPCVQEIPTLKELQKKYEKKNFSVVGLSVDVKGKKVVKDLVAGERINYPVLMADEAVISGFGGVYGIPTAFLVNSRGVVVKKYTGYTPHAVFVRDIEQITN